MSEVKITDLTAAASAADSDVLVIVDVANDTTKKITKGNLVAGLGGSGGGLDSAAVRAMMLDSVSTSSLTISETVDSGQTAVLTFDSDNNASFSGSVTASSFIGDGSQLTGISAGSSGLDSASVQSLIDSNFNDPQVLTFGTSSTVITIGSGANGGTGVAIGNQADASGGGYNVAIGVSAKTDTQVGTVAIGHNARAQGIFSSAYGKDAFANNQYALALGYGVQATGSFAKGIGGNATGNYSVGVGGNATGVGASALGYSAAAAGQSSVALGNDATTASNAQYGIAIGKNAGADNSQTIHINATGQTTNQPQTAYGIAIETSAAGSLTYDQTNDWQFGAAVTAPAFIGDGSGLTNLPSGGGGLDSAAVTALVDSDYVAARAPTGSGSGGLDSDTLSFVTAGGPPPTPYVWMDFDGNTNDSGTANDPATATNPSYDADRNGVNPGSILVESTRPVKWTTNPVSPNSDFFWGVWYKSSTTSFGSSAQVLGSSYGGGEVMQIGATVPNSSTPNLCLRHSVSGGWRQQVASVQPVWTDWNHYALVKSGLNLYLYLNGVLVASDTLSSGITYNEELHVGNYPLGGRADGYYDDIQLYSTLPITAGQSFNPESIGGGDVVASQIAATGDLTTSNLEFKRYESGALTTYDLDDLINQDLSTPVEIALASHTVTGDPNFSTVQVIYKPEDSTNYGSEGGTWTDEGVTYTTGPFAYTAMTPSNNVGVTLGYGNTVSNWWTPNTTLEVWFKPTGSFGDYDIFKHAATTGNGRQWALSTSSNGNIGWFYYNGSIVNVTASNNALNLNEWNHAAVVIDANGDLNLYQNGTRVVGPTAISGTPWNSVVTDESLRLGDGNNTAAFNGDIGMFRMSSMARYSGASYTVPTEDFAVSASTITYGSNAKVGKLEVSGDLTNSSLSISTYESGVSTESINFSGSNVTMTDLTASGATVVFSNLPTTDPVNAGQLWNDNGTLKISAG